MVSNTLSSACLCEENSIAEAIWFSRRNSIYILEKSLCSLLFSTEKLEKSEALINCSCRDSDRKRTSHQNPKFRSEKHMAVVKKTLFT